MPTRQLPLRPNLRQLKHQAKDLLASHRRGDPGAFQRIREFHGRHKQQSDPDIAAAPFTVGDAQLTIAREYGFKNWPGLKAFVENAEPATLNLPHHERIDDPAFRQAVDLLDEGNVEALKTHLARFPDIVHTRVQFEGGNYFTNPTLLEFCAENPIRHRVLPLNIADVAKVILDAGGDRDSESINSTLGLVCSGLVPRECGVQGPLIQLLCGYGANPDNAILPALGHGEFEAVEALLASGATVSLVVAAGTGRLGTVESLLAASDAESRHLALALASQHGHGGVVSRLLDAGEDPNRYNPPGAHAHSTPLHQAALAGHLDVVRMLTKGGARTDIGDIHHNATALEWATHAGQTAVVEHLSQWEKK